MKCEETEKNLSLYLYGELDFAEEEAFEQHIAECAKCDRALAREKAWHGAVRAEQAGAPLDFLAACRQQLKAAISRGAGRPNGHIFERSRWAWPFGVSVSGWSVAVAAASLLLFVGFTAGRWVDRHGIPGVQGGAITNAGLFDPATARIRDIQPGGNDRVRILVDQTRQQAITGSLDDQDVRRWLLAGAKDPADPGLRVDAIEFLKNQRGPDVREVLLDRLEHDPNAGVRLEALEDLRQFRDDPAVQEHLKFVIEHDYDPGVRSEAIDVLAPLQGKVDVTPELANTLDEILRSGQADEYVQMRCASIFERMKTAANVY